VENKHLLMNKNNKKTHRETAMIVYLSSRLKLQQIGSQPAGDVSHEPGGRLPLLSARPAVTLATLTSAATNFAVL